jgi:hypothetical protein
MRIKTLVVWTMCLLIWGISLSPTEGGDAGAAALHMCPAGAVMTRNDMVPILFLFLLHLAKEPPSGQGHEGQYWRGWKEKRDVMRVVREKKLARISGIRQLPYRQIPSDHSRPTGRYGDQNDPRNRQ